MVKMHNAFAYVRWMIAGGLALEAFDNYGQAFSFAMVGASMLARKWTRPVSQTAPFCHQRHLAGS